MSHSDVKSPVADNRTKWSLIEALSLIGALDTHFLSRPWQQTGEVGPKMSSTTPRRKPYYVTQIESDYALSGYNFHSLLFDIYVLALLLKVTTIFVLRKILLALTSIQLVSSAFHPGGHFYPSGSHFYPFTRFYPFPQFSYKSSPSIPLTTSCGQSASIQER